MEREELIAELKNVINESLLRIVISNPRIKDGITKIKIRPVMINGALCYQSTEYIGTQVFHKNYDEDEIVRYVEKMIVYSFKQCEILTRNVTETILVSKKGKITLNRKKSDVNSVKIPENIKMDLNHNRKKNYILDEGILVPFLVDLGVMNNKGEVLKPKYDKFKQINRFLEFIRDVVIELPSDREIKIIDFGCGKSYLTFAIYYYLHDLCGLDVSITGPDLKKDVIEKCNNLSNKYGYDKLNFKLGDIAEYQGANQVDMVVTLHACDTATDYALYKAVIWNAKVILSVPCCQHEVNKQIKNELMSPVLEYGILKDRLSAIMTDAIRAVKKNEKGDREKIAKLVSEFEIQPTIVSLLM